MSSRRQCVCPQCGLNDRKDFVGIWAINIKNAFMVAKLMTIKLANRCCFHYGDESVFQRIYSFTFFRRSERFVHSKMHDYGLFHYFLTRFNHRPIN